MAKLSEIFTHQRQVLFFTVLVCLILTAAFIQSLDHAGLIRLPGGGDSAQDLIEETRATISFEVVNGTDTQYIQPTIMDLTVQFTCVAENVDEVRWDFGDGSGSSEGLQVTTEYDAPGEYLVEATIIFKDGKRVIEYYKLEIGEEIIYTAEVPVFGFVWTFYTYSLLIMGLSALFWFAISFYKRKKQNAHLWPRSFIPELRLALGFGMLFCFFVAIGFFNGIVADIGGFFT